MSAVVTAAAAKPGVARHSSFIIGDILLVLLLNASNPVVKSFLPPLCFINPVYYLKYLYMQCTF